MSNLDEKKQALNKKVSSLIENTVSDTYSDIHDIFTAKIELAKLELTEQLADILAKIIILIVLLIAGLYLVSALAIFIGDISGYSWLGYLLISLVIFIVSISLLHFKPEYLTDKIQQFIYRDQNS